jgi:hypothetical protein
MNAREWSPKSMVPIFIVHARWGLLGTEVQAVVIFMSRLLFGPQVLASAPSVIAELSAACAVSSSTRLAVAALVASSLAK